MQIIITFYLGWLLCEQISSEATTTKENDITQKSQKEEHEIKRKLTKDNQYYNHWKFQIHWNKLEWVNLRSRDEQKNPFCVSSKRKF